MSGATKINRQIGLPLAIGAAIGGIIGRQVFSFVINISPYPELVGAIQATGLLLLTFGTLLYTIFRQKIAAHQLQS